VRTDDGFYLDTTAAEFESFFKFLTMMIFWSKVEITEAELAIVSLLGTLPELPTKVQEAAAFVRKVENRSETPRTDIAGPRVWLQGGRSDRRRAPRYRGSRRPAAGEGTRAFRRRVYTRWLDGLYRRACAQPRARACCRFG